MRLRKYHEDTSTWSYPFVFGAAETCSTCTVASFSHHLIIGSRSKDAKGSVRLIKYKASGSYTNQYCDRLHSIAQLGLSNLDGELWLTNSDMDS